MNDTTKRRRPGNISFVRFKLGLSQQQLADTLGVSRSMIAMVETRKREFKEPVKSLYLHLCDTAKAANPDGYILVKRGHKSARTDFSPDSYSVVTNLGVAPVGTSNEMTQNNSEKAENVIGEFVSRLRQKKKMLGYLHTSLEFKAKAMEQRFSLHTGHLFFVTTMLKAGKDLRDQLPEGRLKDRFELRAAIQFAKQVKLKQQLKKCGPVAQVRLQFQRRLLESQMETIDNTIAGLKIAEETPGNIFKVDKADEKSFTSPEHNNKLGIAA